NRVYVTAAHSRAFGGPYGILYCLDATRAELVWKFDAGGKLKQGFSTPCVADGRVYFGEGWHQDEECKFFCVSADKGELIWEFTTTSHTESSPCVASGKVFFGAGDDGLYCLDAVTGKERWHYQKELHIDANPIVV